MSKEQLVNRLLAMESRVDSQTLRTGNLSDSDWDQVVESSGIIANTKLLLDDTPGITVQSFVLNAVSLSLSMVLIVS